MPATAIAPAPTAPPKKPPSGQKGNRVAVDDPSVLAMLLDVLDDEATGVRRVFNVTLEGDVFRGNAEIPQGAVGGADMYLAFKIDIPANRIGYKAIEPPRGDAFVQDAAGYSKRAGMVLNCRVGNVQCGGKCQSATMHCFVGMTPQQKATLKKALALARRSGTPAPTPAPTSAPKSPTPTPISAPTPTPKSPAAPKTPKTPKSPPAPKSPTPTPAPAAPIVRTNQKQLAAKRTELVNDFGQTTVQKAEANMKKLLDDAGVFIRVGSSATLETILGDRFRTSAELGVNTHTIPGLKDDYQTARNRVEKNSMGYDLDTAKDARPIYGYLGSDNLSGRSHSDLAAAYGSITVKLKDSVKDRATFTGQDSFKSGAASEVKATGSPPPPNAASIVSMTRHGYDIDDLPSHYSALNKSKAHYRSQLDNAANAKDIDDFVRGAAVTGNSYVEAQIHGKVNPSDIAEIHFKPQGAADRPTKAIAQFAKDNGAKLFVDGKEVKPDDLLSPPNRAKEISNAIDLGDFHKVIDLAGDVYDASQGHNFKTGNDGVLKQLCKDAGYDALPQVATAAAVTKTWKDGGHLMVRGANAVGGDRTAALDSFKTGDFYIGNGMYGAGTYCSRANGTTPASANKALKVIAQLDYAKASGVTMRMALPKSAKVGDTIELNTETRRIENKFDQWVADERKKLQASQPVGSKADTKAIREKMDEKNATIAKMDMARPASMSSADYAKYGKIASANNTRVGHIPIVHEYTFADGTKAAVLSRAPGSGYLVMPDGSLKPLDRFSPGSAKSVVARKIAEFKAGELAGGKTAVSAAQMAEFTKSLDPDGTPGSIIGSIKNNPSQAARNPALHTLPSDSILINYNFIHQNAKYRKGDAFMEGAIVVRVGNTYRQIMPDGSLFDHGKQTVDTLRTAVAQKLAEHRLSGGGAKTGATSADLKAFEGKVNVAREVLFGGRGKNNGGAYSERLAVIRGYDAIRLTHSYEKDNFTLLLNRSVVQVQDTEIAHNSTSVATGT